MAYRKSLTEAEKDDIVRRYLLGQTQNLIAFALDSSQITISRVLHERGVAIRVGNKGKFNPRLFRAAGGMR